MKTVFNYTRIMFVAMAAMAVFTSCTKNEDDYIASSLRSSDWEGKITEYYYHAGYGALSCCVTALAERGGSR